MMILKIYFEGGLNNAVIIRTSLEAYSHLVGQRLGDVQSALHAEGWRPALDADTGAIAHLRDDMKDDKYILFSVSR